MHRFNFAVYGEEGQNRVILVFQTIFLGVLLEAGQEILELTGRCHLGCEMESQGLTELIRTIETMCCIAHGDPFRQDKSWIVQVLMTQPKMFGQFPEHLVMSRQHVSLMLVQSELVNRCVEHVCSFCSCVPRVFGQQFVSNASGQRDDARGNVFEKCPKGPEESCQAFMIKRSTGQNLAKTIKLFVAL